MSENSNIKKTRRNYTYSQKNKILNQLEKSKKSILAFSKEANIPTRTLQSWKENKDKIMISTKSEQSRKRLGSTNKTALKKQ